jgi:hypothetical protein
VFLAAFVSVFGSEDNGAPKERRAEAEVDDNN